MKQLALIILFTFSDTSYGTERCAIEPTVLRKAMPEYPAPLGTTADLHTCHEGTVTMEFTVTETGKVVDAVVIDSTLVKGCRNQSAGEDFFHQVSLDTILKYKYSSVPEACRWDETFTFQFEE